MVRVTFLSAPPAHFATLSGELLSAPRPRPLERADPTDGCAPSAAGSNETWRSVVLAEVAARAYGWPVVDSRAMLGGLWDWHGTSASAQSTWTGHGIASIGDAHRGWQGKARLPALLHAPPRVGSSARTRLCRTRPRPPWTTRVQK